MNLIKKDSFESLCSDVGSYIVSISKKAIIDHGRFSLVLSGGSTPLYVYRLLLTKFKESVDWHLVDFFWTDERYVSYEDKDSNYGVARECFLNNLPASNAYQFKITDSIVDDISYYEDTLKQYFNNNPGMKNRFDCVFAGFGLDGHFASIFSHEDLNNTTQSVINTRNSDGQDRLSLSFLRIIQSNKIILISSSKTKSNFIKKGLNISSTLPVFHLPAFTKLFYCEDDTADKKI